MREQRFSDKAFPSMVRSMFFAVLASTIVFVLAMGGAFLGHNALGATTTPGSGCISSITVTNTDFPAAGGQGEISVKTDGATWCCPWQARTCENWIRLSLAPGDCPPQVCLAIVGLVCGAGDGAVRFQVEPNPTCTARTGSIVLSDGFAQWKIEVRQVGGAGSFSIHPSGAAFTQAGGIGEIAVWAFPTNCQWQAVSHIDWATITSPVGGTGVGNGTVTYLVAPLGALLPVIRSGTLTVANNTFTVTQGAQLVLPDLALELVELNKPAYAPGEIGSVTITVKNQGATSTGIGYVVDVIRHAPGTVPCDPKTIYKRVVRPPLAAGGVDTFVVRYANYTGSGSFVFRAFADSTCALLESDETNNQTAVRYLVTPCPVLIAPSAASFSGVGGAGSISVTAPATCSWSAWSHVNWVTLTGGGDPCVPCLNVVGLSCGSGNGTVTYEVAANPGGARTGTVSAGYNTFTVTQAAAPPLPDLVVESFSLNKDTYLPGEIGTATTTVRNQGGTGTGVGYVVDLIRHAPTAVGCSPLTYYKRVRLPALAVGASHTFSVAYVNYIGTGKFVFRVFADSGCVVAEADETNNQATFSYTVRLPTTTPPSTNDGTPTVK